MNSGEHTKKCQDLGMAEKGVHPTDWVGVQCLKREIIRESKVYDGHKHGYREY